MSVVEIVVCGAAALVGGLLAWAGLEGQWHRCVRYSAVQTAVEYLGMVGMPALLAVIGGGYAVAGVLQHLRG